MPVLLVRHAAAGSRRNWDGDDTDRPLDDRGRRQADGLVDALARFDVVRVPSSPAVRCVQTLEPLATAHGVTVESTDDLQEGSGRRGLALVRTLLAPDSGLSGPDGPTVVLCSHGDVIPEILAALEREGTDLGEDRRCQKGSTWALALDRRGTVEAHYLPPPS